MTKAEPDAIRIIVSGRVQGVGYRDWMRRSAGQLGLSGWVRNRRDGTVEAVIAGPRDRIDAMLAACRKGPALARVDGLDITDADIPSSDDFVIAPTI